MVATPRYLSGTNGFLPQATGTVIGYTRDPKEFAANRWVQNIQAPAPVFLYAQIDQDQPVRMVNEAEYAWEDGADRPSGNHNLTSFNWVEGRTFRRDYPYTLGLQAVETARKLGAFDPELVEAKSVASQAMTNRVNRLINLCETAGNWGNNTATANVLNGGAGYWDTASNDPTDPGYLAIKKSLLEALRRINLGTNGMVKPKDMRLVLSPGLAMAMANTGEIHDYVKSTANTSIQNLTDTLGNVNEQWGLPPKLYGVEVVVEDAVKVTIYPNADGTKASTALSERAYCKSDTNAFLTSQPGGIDAPYGTKSFGTVQCYFYEYEMAVQSRTDTWHQKIEGHVVEQFKEVLAAAPSGFLITGTKAS
jgi:hypothetical protein